MISCGFVPLTNAVACCQLVAFSVFLFHARKRAVFIMKKSLRHYEHIFILFCKQV